MRLIRLKERLNVHKRGKEEALVGLKRVLVNPDEVLMEPIRGPGGPNEWRP